MIPEDNRVGRLGSYGLDHWRVCVSKRVCKPFSLKANTAWSLSSRPGSLDRATRTKILLLLTGFPKTRKMSNPRALDSIFSPGKPLHV